MGNKFVTIWNSQFSNCSSEWSISIWLKSHLYWYVTAWEIWGNHYRSHASDSMYHPMKSEETITGHMRVILCIIQWNLRKPLQVTCEWFYVSSNETGNSETMIVLLNCFVYYKQLYCSKNVIPRFIIFIYIYSWRKDDHSHVTHNGVSSDLPHCDISVKVNKWEILS
jgi:hypothetical protein